MAMVLQANVILGSTKQEKMSSLTIHSARRKPDLNAAGKYDKQHKAIKSHSPLSK